MIPSDIAQTIIDPDAYSLQDPVDRAFDFLRKEMPLAKAEPEGYDPFWVVTKYDDIMSVERRADVFHMGDRSNLLVTREQDKITRDATGGDPNFVKSLASSDGELHRIQRDIGVPAFTPRAMEKLKGAVREIAKEFVGEMLGSAPECDFSQEIAFLYPLRVVMQLMGVPVEDEPMMLKLTQEIFSGNDPDLNSSGVAVSPAEFQRNYNAAMNDLYDYFERVTVEHRANPRDCLNSYVANAKDADGEYALSPRLIHGFFITIATAGHDTTSNTTAGAMAVLAERPELLARLKANPGDIPSFVEESIRWVAPLKSFMKSATEDTEINGTKIDKGDWLMVAFYSGCRDEDVFENPYTFDIDRKKNKHLAFGYGPHACLGQHLARMEMQILWEELLPRLKSVKLDGEVKLTRSNFVCGAKTVPIQFEIE